jgi:hypothetical protein
MANGFFISMAVDVLVEESLWEVTTTIKEFRDSFSTELKLFAGCGA